MRKNTYKKNLETILAAIKGKGIKTAERMIEQEIKEMEGGEKDNAER